VENGLIQGFGMGFVFVPLSALAYSTLAPHHRNDAAAVFSLIRNIGSSVGISVVTTLLARNIQINHAELGSHLVNYGAQGNLLDSATDQLSASGETSNSLLMLDSMVNSQAATIAYLNDFRLMMMVVLLVIPLLIFLRRTAAPAAGNTAP
ncbi:MAG TPA: EmrB/QacA family drug resistance transporter, partial [Candidatus Kapabacteria bacterium]|nr:EmrB/QacA family drug resistance transporter [Candidatus Kapabacteria bacterium]